MRTSAFCFAVLVAGCLGGQTQQTKNESARVGDQSGAVHPAATAKKDWKEAARGTGAAGAIPAEDLARMEKESAPGATIQRDAGR